MQATVQVLLQCSGRIFFLYDFKHSNNEIYISKTFSTTYTNYCVYRAIFRHVVKIKYLETFRYLKMKVLLFLQNMRTDYAVMQHCIPDPQSHGHENLKTCIQENYLSLLLCPISLCCVTKLYQAILILAWPGLF